MKFARSFVIFALTFSFATLIESPDADAFVELWARGHGTYLDSPTELRHFEENDKGLGYGFALGGKFFFIGGIVDINFFPDGSMFNQVGIASEFDLSPIPKLSIKPLGQALYFYAPHADSSAIADKGLHARSGLQVEYEVLPFTRLGIEGLGGYLLALPETEHGFVYSGSLYLKFRVGL